LWCTAIQKISNVQLPTANSKANFPLATEDQTYSLYHTFNLRSYQMLWMKLIPEECEYKWYRPVHRDAVRSITDGHNNPYTTTCC
jgi:hypothetical protein